MVNALNFIQKGFELKNNKSYKQAIEMFYKALEIENNNIEILFQLGELYYLLFNYERANHYLEQVLNVDKNHPESLKLLIKISINEKKYEQALSYAENLLKVEQNEENIITTIKIYQELHDIKNLKTFEKYEEINIKITLMKAYYNLQEFNSAYDEAKKILDKDNNNVEAKIILGKIHFDRNEITKSREIFENFDKNTTNPEILNYLGLFALDDLNYIDAVQYFSRAIMSDKNNSLYYYNLGNAYFFNGWIKEAITSYLNAIKYNCDNLDYRYSLAYLYYNIKAFDKCKSEVKYILSINENHYKTRTLEALLKFENKDFLGAEQILLTNIKSGDNDSFTNISLAQVYSELSMYDKAEKLVEKILKKNSDNLDYKCELAKIYIKEGKYNKALEITNKIIETNENYIKAYILSAESEFYLKNYEESKSYSQNAISLDINYAKGYFWLAKNRIEEKDYNEAIECMKRAIMFDLNNASYYAQMSNIYKEKNDTKTALEYAKEAESLDHSEEYRILCTDLANINRKKINNSIKNLSSTKK